MFVDLLREVCGDEKTAPGEIRFCCPFCGEDEYKLYQQDEAPFLWTCFKCGERGNPQQFVMLYYDVQYREAVGILQTYDYDVNDLELSEYKSKYNDDSLTETEQMYLALSQIERNGEVTKKDVTYTLPPLPTGIQYLCYNPGNPQAAPFVSYLARRGLVWEDVLRHGVGYVVDGTVELISGKTLRLQNHVVFLTYNDAGEPIYWNTRAINHDAFIKSFNAPSKDGEYGKFNTIFNLNNAQRSGRIIINEGVFNAISCGISGVATFGKQVTEQQVQLLKRAYEGNNDFEFFIFLDRDAYTQGVELAEKLSRFSDKVSLIMNDTDDDANDMEPERVKQLIDTALPFNVENEMKYLLLGMGG